MEYKYRRWITSLSLLFLAACNGSTTAPGEALGTLLGEDHVTDPPAAIPVAISPKENTPVPGPGPTPPVTTVGPTCHSADPNQICLGLKYVVYNTTAGTPVVSQQQSIDNIDGINSVWNSCGIKFQIDQFLPVTPQSENLVYNTSSYSELDEIRSDFATKTDLLVVTTGSWDRSGTLGNTGANAWTTMPDGGLYGVVLESPVGTYVNIIAHELGHYLNLDHVSDTSNLMSPIIYSSSTGLTTNQCQEARSAVQYFWAKMLR